eukprot:2348349-Rhodomonas_salina.5
MEKSVWRSPRRFGGLTGSTCKLQFPLQLSYSCCATASDLSFRCSRSSFGVKFCSCMTDKNSASSLICRAIRIWQRAEEVVARRMNDCFHPVDARISLCLGRCEFCQQSIETDTHANAQILLFQKVLSGTTIPEIRNRQRRA